MRLAPQIDIQNAKVNTAGAYVCINGLYPFAIGTQLHNGCIPIVRLGGHREEHETGWQCAVREVYEEANLEIKPLSIQTTFLADWDHLDTDLREIQWQPQMEEEPAPILVVTYRREDRIHLSLMYMAQADGIPIPSSEVKGLLLLDQENIVSLCQGSLTLGQYLHRGGQAILNYPFDTTVLLAPFAQLRLLARILCIQANQQLT